MNEQEWFYTSDTFISKKPKTSITDKKFGKETSLKSVPLQLHPLREYINHAMHIFVGVRESGSYKLALHQLVLNKSIYLYLLYRN